jgi:hypothetical protein
VAYIIRNKPPAFCTNHEEYITIYFLRKNQEYLQNLKKNLMDFCISLDLSTTQNMLYRQPKIFREMGGFQDFQVIERKI